MRHWIILAALIFAAPAFAADARLMLNIMKCESGMRYDVCGDDGVSCGIAQFQKATFYEFAAMSKKDGTWKTALGKPSWLNPAQQVFLLEWGLDNGYGERWTCFRKLEQRREYSPEGRKYYEGVKWRARQVHVERWRIHHHHANARKLL